MTEPAAGVTEFAHMLLKVRDVERSTAFYEGLLGLTRRNAKPLPDGRPFIPFNQGLALTSGGSDDARKIDHFAFRAKNVASVYKKLKAAEVRFDRELHDGLYGLTIYVYDPDGNMVELFEEGAKMPQ